MHKLLTTLIFSCALAAPIGSAAGVTDLEDRFAPQNEIASEVFCYWDKTGTNICVILGL